MDWSNFAVAALTGMFTIAGVGIGAWMAQRAELKRQKIELLSEAYARFTADAFSCAETITFENAKSLSVSVARVGLLCSKEAHQKADEIAMLAVKRPIDPEKLSSLMDEFLSLAKKEIE